MNKLDNMQLTKTLTPHIIELMSWFLNGEELTDWSGPDFRYPYNLTTFREDLSMNNFNTFSLISDPIDLPENTDSTNELLAFGQYYERLGRCHLARLIVNPQYRGKGIAAQLMKQLIDIGLNDLQVTTCSLFVWDHNKSAINSYLKYGFTVSDYPENIPLENCLYMIK